VVVKSLVGGAVLWLADLIAWEDEIKVWSKLWIDVQEHGKVEVVGLGKIIESVSFFNERQELSDTLGRFASSDDASSGNANSVSWEDKVDVAGELGIGTCQLVQVKSMGFSNEEQSISCNDTLDLTSCTRGWVTWSRWNRGGEGSSSK
jgi:hypothetical protein